MRKELPAEKVELSLNFIGKEKERIEKIRAFQILANCKRLSN